MSESVPSAVYINLFNLHQSSMEQVAVRSRRCQGTHSRSQLLSGGCWIWTLGSGSTCCTTFLLFCVSLQTNFPACHSHQAEKALWEIAYAPRLWIVYAVLISPPSPAHWSSNPNSQGSSNGPWLGRVPSTGPVSLASEVWPRTVLTSAHSFIMAGAMGISREENGLDVQFKRPCCRALEGHTSPSNSPQGSFLFLLITLKTQCMTEKFVAISSENTKWSIFVHLHSLCALQKWNVLTPDF